MMVAEANQAFAGGDEVNLFPTLPPRVLSKNAIATVTSSGPGDSHIFRSRIVSRPRSVPSHSHIFRAASRDSSLLMGFADDATNFAKQVPTTPPLASAAQTPSTTPAPMAPVAAAVEPEPSITL